jgi:hypothetical protein
VHPYEPQCVNPFAARVLAHTQLEAMIAKVRAGELTIWLDEHGNRAVLPSAKGWTIALFTYAPVPVADVEPHIAELQGHMAEMMAVFN